jgi:hypothetical protein
VGESYRWTSAEEPDSIPISRVPEVRASVTLSLDQKELGQYGLNGLTGYYGPDPLNRRTTAGPYAIGRSPRVVQPDNARANARLAKEPALQSQLSIQPRHACERARRAPTNDQRPTTNEAQRLVHWRSPIGQSQTLVVRRWSLVHYAEAVFAAFSRFARRDLRRAAVFLWMMPRFAALSTRLDVSLKTVCAALRSPPMIVARVFFTNVLIADFTD